MRAVRKHDEWLTKKLKNARFAAEYLNAASEDDDPASYMAALRKVAEARGGVAQLAEDILCRDQAAPIARRTEEGADNPCQDVPGGGTDVFCLLVVPSARSSGWARLPLPEGAGGSTRSSENTRNLERRCPRRPVHMDSALSRSS